MVILSSVLTAKSRIRSDSYHRHEISKLLRSRAPTVKHKTRVTRSTRTKTSHRTNKVNTTVTRPKADPPIVMGAALTPYLALASEKQLQAAKAGSTPGKPTGGSPKPAGVGSGGKSKIDFSKANEYMKKAALYAYGKHAPPNALPLDVLRAKLKVLDAVSRTYGRHRHYYNSGKISHTGARKALAALSLAGRLATEAKYNAKAGSKAGKSEADKAAADTAQKGDNEPVGSTDFPWSVYKFLDSFFKGIYYGIWGPPEGEDLRDEIGAVKSVGGLMMLLGPILSLAGSVTGVGALTNLGFSTGIMGWALTDNYAGRLEFLDYQMKKKRKDADAYSYNYVNYWRNVVSGLSNYPGSYYPYYRLHYGKRQYYRYKYKPHVERMSYEAGSDVVDFIKSAFYRIKDLMWNASQLSKQDRLEDAVSLWSQAKGLAEEIDKVIERSNLVLREIGIYSLLKRMAESTIKMIDANIKYAHGYNPTMSLHEAFRSYARSSELFFGNVEEYLATQPYPNFRYWDSDRAYYKAYKNALYSNVLQKMLGSLVMQWTNYMGYLPQRKSKLSYSTILKFRMWLKNNIKTPLGVIPTERWEQANGDDYTVGMIRLMFYTLYKTGVRPEEVQDLTLEELEAILRARQYIYLASKRGYFLPYEYELFCKFKELLMLDTYDVYRLLRVRPPAKVMQKPYEIRPWYGYSKPYYRYQRYS